MTSIKQLKTIRKIVKPNAKKSQPTFKSIYKDLGDNAKKQFLLNAQALTGRSEKTIYRYISGTNLPSKADQQIIAGLLNKTVSEIFR